MRLSIHKKCTDQSKGKIMLVVVVIYHSSPHQIEPKPCAGGITHGVWTMPVCMVGVPPGHMQW